MENNVCREIFSVLVSIDYNGCSLSAYETISELISKLPKFPNHRESNGCYYTREQDGRKIKRMIVEKAKSMCFTERCIDVHVDVGRHSVLYEREYVNERYAGDANTKSFIIANIDNSVGNNRNAFCKSTFHAGNPNCVNFKFIELPVCMINNGDFEIQN